MPCCVFGPFLYLSFETTEPVLKVDVVEQRGPLLGLRAGPKNVDSGCTNEEATNMTRPRNPRLFLCLLGFNSGCTSVGAVFRITSSHNTFV